MDCICRMRRGSDGNLNHRMIKIGRNIWKSLVNHLIEAELTSKLDEAAQGLVPLTFDFIKGWQIHHLPVYLFQCLTSRLMT